MGLVMYKVAWAEAYLCIKRHLDLSSRLATTAMGRKLGAVPLMRTAGFPPNTMWPRAEAYLTASGILIYPAVWPKQIWAENWGGAVLLRGGELGPHLIQCHLGRRLPPYQVAS